MIGSWFGFVWITGKVVELICVSAPAIGASVGVARVRSSLSVRSMSSVVPLTRSYHIACRPLASAASHGWKRSLMWSAATVPEIACGLLQVTLLSREKLRKIRVALLLPPPGPSGRSFQAMYRVPFASLLIAGSSKLRMSWPGAVSITSRRSVGRLQATILSALPLTAATLVTRSTVPLLTSNVAIISFEAVPVGLAQAAGVCWFQETNTFPPTASGVEPCAHASAADTLVVRQWMPSVESVSMIGLTGALEKNVHEM